MRLTREYVFDMIELVGKAITTARKKDAEPEWDMEDQIPVGFQNSTRGLRPYLNI